MRSCKGGRGLGEEKVKILRLWRRKCLPLANVRVSEHGNAGSLPVIFKAVLLLIFKELGRPPGLMEQMATKTYDSDSSPAQRNHLQGLST